MAINKEELRKEFMDRITALASEDKYKECGINVIAFYDETTLKEFFIGEKKK